MGRTLPLSRNFDEGFQSDESRNLLGPSAAFRMRDYIPQLEAPLRKRGGWSFGSPALNTLGGSASSVASIGWLAAPSGGQLIAISNAGTIYRLERFDGAGGHVVTDVGDPTIVPTWPIFWHRKNRWVTAIILPGLGQGAKTPKRVEVDDTGILNVDNIGGGPPKARAGFSWGDYLVLMNYYDPTDSNNLHVNRMAFSAPGDPDSWSLTGTTAKTVDFPEEIIAGIPLSNSILVWGYGNLHYLTGDTPPPGGNLSRKILFAGNGTFDGRSCVPWRSYAVWANAAGVWQSDGATLTDLTAQGGISIYWRQIVSGFTVQQGWSAVAGIYRDHYVISIVNSVGTLVTTLVCDLARKVWTEWTNIPSVMFAQRSAGPGTALYGGDEELFFAHKSLPRVGKISSLWTPSATYAADADGTNVLPVLETPFYDMGNDAQKRIRNVYVTYDVRSAGGASALRASMTLSPEVGAAYTQLSPDLAETTQQQRRPVGVRRAALGVGLKIEQIGASDDTRIFGIDAEGHPREQTR